MFGFHYPEPGLIAMDFFKQSVMIINEPQIGLKNKCEENLMNWKLLLVVATLSLSAGLTSCKDKAAEAPADTKPADVTAPAADAPKGDAPKADAPKGDAPKGEGMKGDAPKGDAPKTDAKKDAPKKP